MIRKPFQSKLLPHMEFIRECRAQEMSYPRIAAELRARFGLSAAPSTVFAFVKVRSRRRTVVTLLTPATTNAAPVPAEARTQVQSARGAAKSTSPANWLGYDPNQPLEKITP